VEPLDARARLASAIRRTKSLNVTPGPLPPSVPMLSCHGRHALWRQGWLRGTCFEPTAASLHSLEMVLWLTLNDRPMSLRASPASLLFLASAT
jgi:hypothetical protein